MKIVYVIDSLASKGGAERILSEKMNYLSDKFGYEVYVVTCYQNQEENPNAYFLSPKVNQVNLNIPYYSQYHYGYPKRLFVKWRIYRSLCKSMASAINKINPDILIGLGYFMGDVVCKLNCRAKKVIESHEARMFTMSDQGLARSYFSRLYMSMYRRYYFNAIERRSDVLVTLTKGDAQEWKKANEVIVIPNFTLMSVEEGNYCDNKRAIAVGRLEWQKGFDRLIDAWEKVSKNHSDWHLNIFGSGTLHDALENQIKAKGLQNFIEIHSFTPNIVEEYKKSSLFVLSSRFEGLPLVLLEAMQCGVPCVAFDCPFGASDVIDDGKCGLVVEDGNVELLAERICYLIEHPDIRKEFAMKSIERARNFSVDEVMGKWRSLFERLVLSQ